MATLQNGNSIAKDFDLPLSRWIEIAEEFGQKVRQGLEKDHTEIKCLPSYIFPTMKGIIKGITYVLDLGGSNLRGAVVSLDENGAHFLTPVKTLKMPWLRNVPFPRNDFLAMQADLLKSLDFPQACPLGYCFSFPTEALPNGDATLIQWTKGLQIPETLGENIGGMLTDYIAQHCPEVKITSVCVLNDTVASLFAGLARDKTDACIGLIVGTGTNMASFFPADHVPKIKGVVADHRLIPINLESGNFNAPFLNQWDQKVDSDSDNKGEQLFEKAVSGMYLGWIFKAVFPNSPLDADAGAKGLVEMLNSEQQVPEDHRAVATAIYERSFKLVAAQLAGLIQVLDGYSSIKTVKIVAEGGLFWSKVHPQKAYAQCVQDQLADLRAKMGLGTLKIEFRKLDQANLLGSAMAALSVED
ncbi:MAG: hexokinase [Desulfobacteraceae bacterium]|nr:hexokinase [Desulfobacteraceae bacterium]